MACPDGGARGREVGAKKSFPVLGYPRKDGSAVATLARYTRGETFRCGTRLHLKRSQESGTPVVTCWKLSRARVASWKKNHGTKDSLSRGNILSDPETPSSLSPIRRNTLSRNNFVKRAAPTQNIGIPTISILCAGNCTRSKCSLDANLMPRAVKRAIVRQLNIPSGK